MVLLTVLQAVIGLWMLLLPRSFYDLPPVSMFPPYSEHLFRDFGGANLGMAVMLGAAAFVLERRLVAAALVAYLMYTVPHFVFHATHLEHFSTSDAIVQTTGLAIDVLLPLALLVLNAKVASAPRGRPAKLPA